jgi:ribosomal protein S18 acetylase RimI-like enzyme
MIEIRAFEQDDEEAVVRLWHRCGLVTSLNDPAKDIRRKLEVHPELFLVAVLEGGVVGTVMAGYEGHRGWINYLAVDPTRQKKGIGRQLVTSVENLLKALGCPKINLQVRSGNIEVQAFYAKIGFVQEPVTSFGKRLAYDD